MCKKINNRIECEKCGYPYKEALYIDDTDIPLDCNSSQLIIDNHIKTVKELKQGRPTHYWDCKCWLCR